jgi:type II secretory ATPase GspE/PulE/Tfp pilus assembly ATPase PilB-like protein
MTIAQPWIHLTLAADPLLLVSWWKPLLFIPPFIGWGWLVSKIFDKHAARFYLPRQAWNTAHLCVGLLALVVAFFMPIQGEAAFWAGLGAAVVLLALDVAVFVFMANRDERVPEEHRLKLDFSKLSAARAESVAKKKAGKVELVIKGPDKQAVPVPTQDTPEFQLRVASEAIITAALDSRASQVDIAPAGKDNAYGVSSLIDGVRQPQGQAMSPADAVRVIDFWKAAAKLDVADRRRRQVGDVNVERGSDRKKLRLTTLGAQGGPRLSILVDPEGQVRRKPEDMGLREQQLAELKAIVTEGHGVVLMAGMPDAGRTTTLYTVLKMHDAYTQNVQTVEIDIQDAMEGSRQNKFDPQSEGPEFSTLVRSILRRDPDVVGIAELPDSNTAKEVARADPDRTRTYVCVKADSAIKAIELWMKTHGEAEPAAKVLHGVIAQRLGRKVCVNCRVPYQPSPDMLKKLGLPAEKVKQLFKKGGQVLIKNRPEVCPVCQGTGYLSQDGYFEVYSLGQEEREMIAAGNLNGLRAALRKKSLPTMQQAALLKAVDGTTTVEEVMRVTAEAAAPGGPSAPAAAAAAPQKS